MSLTIRPAGPDDAGLVHSFVTALAVYEKLAHEVEATPDMVAEALGGANPRVFADLAFWDEVPAGFALWFYNYSTFRGRHGIYLEDLFVALEHRGRGIGKALLERLGRRCVEEGLGRLEWWVLKWNRPSIDFYESLGAVAMDEWQVYRLTGAALERLGRIG